ncbi:predicted protein [Naegleria gruberi]|uniref:Predicted protein n=1 Tax=Naegleria gruberi TaxID=5762 RepID=D2VJV0_NAEGR|nr:uncharacterized protein NAEGRDRAFT_50144 [Naegleria gruberi]EFC42834.1 predicted protein [Naegleria gruberi]|eukprot:XP_002675578.1 predicted protein [Naegleria gruberi strain NEG-M]
MIKRFLKHKDLPEPEEDASKLSSPTLLTPNPPLAQLRMSYEKKSSDDNMSVISDSNRSSMSNLHRKSRNQLNRGISSRFVGNLQRSRTKESLASEQSMRSSMSSFTQSTSSASSGMEGQDFEDLYPSTRVEDYLELNVLVNQLYTCGFPILIFDSNLTIEYLNREAEDLFGLFTFSIMGEYLSEVLSAESTMDVRSLIENYIGMDEETFENNPQIQALNNVANVILPISLITPEEKQKRRDELKKSRQLTGKSVTEKRIFQMKTNLVVLNKLNQIHFAMYMQPMKQSQEDAQKLASIQFAETITDLSVVPIIGINDKGTVLIFNKASTTTFQYQRKEIVGKNIKMLVPSKIRNLHDGYLKRVVDQVRALKAVNKSGKSVRIELRVSEIIDPLTSVSSFVAFIRDAKQMVTKEEQMNKITEKIFPKNVVQRLTMGQTVFDTIPTCSLMYCDIVGFTALSNGKPPSEIVKLLHEIFSAFDDIVYGKQVEGLEKIKTIGDCYFVGSGLYKEKKRGPQVPTIIDSSNGLTHADHCVKAGILMIKELKSVMEKKKDIECGSIQVRIGIHTSNNNQVFAAVVGKTKRTYDLFGPEVATTQLIEATGKPNQVHITSDTFNTLRAQNIVEMFVEYYKQDEEVLLEKNGICVIPKQTYITDLD